MCKCNPSIKTPFCGKCDCVLPKQEETTMTKPAPITVIDLMRNIAHIRMSDGAREKMRQMLHQFAAEQRAQGAAELQQIVRRVNEIAVIECPDYPGVKTDTVYGNLHAIESSLKGREMACNDLHEVVEQLRTELAAMKQRLEAAICFISGIKDQTPEKPDYWSSCGQCHSNSNKADDLLDEINAAIAAQAKEPCQHLRRQTHKSITQPGVERDRCADCGELLSIGAAQEKGE